MFKKIKEFFQRTHNKKTFGDSSCCSDKDPMQNNISKRLDMINDNLEKIHELKTGRINRSEERKYREGIYQLWMDNKYSDYQIEKERFKNVFETDADCYICEFKYVLKFDLHDLHNWNNHRYCKEHLPETPPPPPPERDAHKISYKGDWGSWKRE